MKENRVYMVDDAADVLKSVSCLLRSVNIEMQAYQDPLLFLANLDDLQPGCVLLDVRMPNISGLEILKTVRERHPNLPVIIITAYGDVPMAVRAIKSGAIDFICKPFNDQALIESIQRVLSCTEEVSCTVYEIEETAKLYSTLSPREQQVLALVTDGDTNKQIAEELNIAIPTVEMHRSNIMKKMKVANVAQLIKKTLILKLQ